MSLAGTFMLFGLVKSTQVRAMSPALSDRKNTTCSGVIPLVMMTLVVEVAAVQTGVFCRCQRLGAGGRKPCQVLPMRSAAERPTAMARRVEVEVILVKPV